MDSINTLKGYGKVGHVQEPPKSKKRNIIITAVAATALVAILLCYTSTSFAPHTDSPEVNYISAVCNRTAHPATCAASLQNSTGADPEELVRVSLEISLRHLANLSSIPVRISDPKIAPAALDCKSLVADSVDGVKASIAVMEVEGGEMVLTLAKINDMQTWVSAAMTNLETCVDGLKELGGVWEEMVSGVGECEVYLSNSLGIIAKIASILDELHIPMH